jgi:2,6-dihydroxypyridine 3-monooxygenase
VQERHVKKLRDAATSELPPPIAEVLLKTAEPFVQVVFDIEVPRMAFGRVCLIGDAAFTLRPHAAAGTAKAAEDAWKLGEAVRKMGGDVVAALKRWEPGQLELGRQVLARTRDAGRRSQFEGTWRIGDPLPFGLYEVGDSAMP